MARAQVLKSLDKLDSLLREEAGESTDEIRGGGRGGRVGGVRVGGRRNMYGNGVVSSPSQFGRGGAIGGVRGGAIPFLPFAYQWIRQSDYYVQDPQTGQMKPDYSILKNRPDIVDMILYSYYDAQGYDGTEIGKKIRAAQGRRAKKATMTSAGVYNKFVNDSDVFCLQDRSAMTLRDAEKQIKSLNARLRKAKQLQSLGRGCY